MCEIYFYQKKWEIKESAGDRPERTRVYKTLPLFSKGKVKFNSHTRGKRTKQTTVPKRHKASYCCYYCETEEEKEETVSTCIFETEGQDI